MSIVQNIKKIFIQIRSFNIHENMKVKIVPTENLTKKIHLPIMNMYELYTVMLSYKIGAIVSSLLQITDSFKMPPWGTPFW